MVLLMVKKTLAVNTIPNANMSCIIPGTAA